MVKTRVEWSTCWIVKTRWTVKIWVNHHLLFFSLLIPYLKAQDFSTEMNKPDLDIQKILFLILGFERNYFKTWFLPNRLLEFVCIDIKMCLRVTKVWISDPASKGTGLINFFRCSVMKNGNPRLFPTPQKIKTIFDFFVILVYK